MKILNLISVVILVIAIFSTNSFAWSYAQAHDTIVQCAEESLLEKDGILHQPVDYVYVKKVYKVVNGPSGENYNNISFHVLTVNVIYPPAKGGHRIMLLYLIAAETEQGVYFLGGSEIVDDNKELKNKLAEFIESAEKYELINEMIEYIDS